MDPRLQNDPQERSRPPSDRTRSPVPGRAKPEPGTQICDSEKQPGSRTPLRGSGKVAQICRPPLGRAKSTPPFPGRAEPEPGIQTSDVAKRVWIPDSPSGF